MLTVYRIQADSKELYEEYLAKRKVDYIRNMPGVRGFQVFRRARRLEPDNPSQEFDFDIVAVIDVDDVEAFQAERAGDEYDEFRREYVHLLEPAPVPIYEAERIECEAGAGLSAGEFWAGREELRGR
jgi:heme-degrading monooxygenase HmoA